MKVAYITAQTPYGKREQFILPEIIEFVNTGNEVLVLPLRPEKELFDGEEPKTVSEYTLPIPLYSGGVFLMGATLFLQSPIKSLKLIGRILTKSGNPKKVIKNLSVFGKGLTLSEVVKRRKVDHIHAHWAGTTSTVAYIASYFSEIPWSFTCHRWDIAENNMLEEKVKSAKFVRAINDNGYNEIMDLVGEEAREKCYKLHSGVNIKPNENRKRQDRDVFSIVVPGNLIEVKGHTYLIDTIDILVKNGYKVKCYLYGNGELEDVLKNKVNKLGLNEAVIFNNKLAHDKLLSLYDEGKVDCVVLPSIVTQTEKEGIPVSLMEAMACKIPVVATNTGGIPELLEGNAGILVNEKNPKELAESIIKLIEDKSYYEEIAEKGYNRVYEDFYLPNIVEKLIALMK